MKDLTLGSVSNDGKETNWTQTLAACARSMQWLDLGPVWCALSLLGIIQIKEFFYMFNIPS